MSFDKNNFESSFINTPVIGNSGGPEPAYFQAHSSVRLFFCGWEHCDRTFHDEVDSYHHFINDHIPKRSLHPFRVYINFGLRPVRGGGGGARSKHSANLTLTAHPISATFFYQTQSKEIPVTMVSTDAPTF